MSEFLKRMGEGLGPLFSDLERRTRETLDLTAKVRRCLGENEKEHLISATYDDETLVIVTDSSAWASRIRYGQEQLLAALRDQGESKGSKVRVRVGARSA
ncbi:MAG: DciA family protein [Povalibacter sp.]